MTDFTPPPPTQAPDLPSIQMLGLWLAATEYAHERHDQRAIAGEDVAIAMDTLQCRQEALRALIASLRAHTLADAAVQLGIAVGYADSLDASTGTDPTFEKDRLRAILRLVLSAAPVVAEAAGLAPDEYRLGANQRLADRRFAGGERAA